MPALTPAQERYCVCDAAEGLAAAGFVGLSDFVAAGFVAAGLAVAGFVALSGFVAAGLVAGLFFAAGFFLSGAASSATTRLGCSAAAAAASRCSANSARAAVRSDSCRRAIRVNWSPSV